MYRTVVCAVAAVGLICCAPSSAEAECSSNIEEARTVISQAEEGVIPLDKKGEFLEGLARAHEHCEAGREEEAHSELKKVKNNDLYTKVFEQADEH